MKLEQSFEVAAPLQEVWRALIDVERVAPCLPGAEVTGRNDDGSYNGSFVVKIGPTSASYTGKLEMERIEEDTHTAIMRANGTDRRGQGGAKAKIVSKLELAGAGTTRVDVATDYSITGRLARFGRGGMIEDISERLLREFADCLQATLAQAPRSAAARPDSAGGGSAGDGVPQPPLGEPDPLPPVQPGKPVEGISLLCSVLWNRTRRNPAAIAVLLAGLLLAAVRFRSRRR